MARLNYDVQLFTPDEDTPCYQVVAKRKMVLELSALKPLSTQFEELAEKFDANNDGCGAEIVE
ncbi:ribonuclease E inhibitor RraB [Acidovorax sp.]|uniref:ribonuclease E inhibitor RraB n=1 Tax=Acidovorax sp. TaxID=1872122 RepID=UPI003421D8CA